MKKTITTLAAPGGVASDTPPSASPSLVAPGTFDDALLASQLTEQYHLAVGGMAQVTRFGAMMMMLRQHLSTVVQVRTTGGKFDAKAEGSIKKWITEHAPDVKPSTAFRFLHVAEAVAKDFRLPAKVSFIELATADFDQLPEKLQQKQTELWDFVNGTSQRSWLDRFSPPKPVGGNQRATAEGTPLAAVLNKSPEEAEEMRRQEVLRTLKTLLAHRDHADWHTLKDEEIRLATDLLGGLAKEMKEWVSLPRSERTGKKLKHLASK